MVQKGQKNAKLTMQSDKFFGVTHIGLVRMSNEDRYLIKQLNEKSCLIAVADGPAGEATVDYAVEILREKLAGLNNISRKEEQLVLNLLV